MKYAILILMTVTFAGCSHLPPPCHGFNGAHPCGDKVLINGIAHE